MGSHEERIPCCATRIRFAYAARAFLDPNRIVQADTRYNYGEDRYRLIGMIDERLFVLAYTPRRSAIRIISARKANRREVSHYEHYTRDP